jgi:hypothetical protein
MVDGLSLTACGELCLSRFACTSFTHIDNNAGNGKCQLYAKGYRNPAYNVEHKPQHNPANTKDLYRLKRCIPNCPANIMDRFTRAANFRTQYFTAGPPSASTFDYPTGFTGHDAATGQWLTPYQGGYRPKYASSFTHHCTTSACSTVEGCAQACYDAGTTGAGACKGFNFRTGQAAGEEQCKFYAYAFVPQFLVEHGTKQFYHLTVGSNCLAPQV